MARRSWKAFSVESEDKVRPVSLNGNSLDSTELEAFS